MKARDIFLAILIVCAWGGYFTSNKVSLDTIPPALFGFARFFCVFLITLPFFFKSFKFFKVILLMSIIYFLDIHSTLLATNASDSIIPIIIVSQLVGPLTIIFGAVYFKEKISKNTVIGLIFTIFGSIFVLGQKEILGISFEVIYLCLLSAIMFSVYNVLTRKVETIEAFTILSQISFLVSVYFLMSACFRGEIEKIDTISQESVYALLYSVLVVSIFGNGCWIYLLKKYSLSKVAPFTILIPIFGTIMSVIHLEEIVNLNMIVGIILVVLGLIITQIKSQKFSLRKYV